MDSTTATPGMYHCHMCDLDIRPLMTPQPTCPRCNGGFVEELSTSRAAALQDQQDDEQDTHNFSSSIWANDAGMGARTTGSGGGGLDFSQLMAGVFRGLAAAGQDTHDGSGAHTSNNHSPSSSSPSVPSWQQSSPSSNSRNAGQQSPQSQTDNRNNSGGFRTGRTQFGPVNVSWGVGSSSRTAAADPFGAAQRAHAQQHTSNSHDDFVRSSIDQHARQHVHDDGMGGAGGAADGRLFNFDNQSDDDITRRSNPPYGMHTAHDLDGDTRNNNSNTDSDLPPELASLRDVFSNLFGGFGDGPAGMLMDMLGGALRGGRSGDYVWGQQGLDDVITQLMEQTRGSTAPPPASEETIAKLERFSRADVQKVRQARNRECSTCMDSFEEEEEESKRTTKDAAGKAKQDQDSQMRDVDDDDDPPEQVPLEGQQDELVMMPCRHLFHEDCIVPWLKTSSTCPVCRVSIEPKDDQHRHGRTTETSTSTSTSTSTGTSTGTSTNISTGAGLFRLPQQPASTPMLGVPLHDDTDVEDDDISEREERAEQRRERTRRAAEARFNSGTGSDTPRRDSGNGPPRLPGAFFSPDDLD